MARGGNLKDVAFYLIVIGFFYYVLTRHILFQEGFQSPVPDFCMITPAVENCRCDDFHPCKNGFTCQNGLCRVPQ
jgi:hypothetical protein